MFPGAFNIIHFLVVINGTFCSVNYPLLKRVPLKRHSDLLCQMHYIKRDRQIQLTNFSNLKNVSDNLKLNNAETVFLVVCNPPMNELLAK